MPQNSIPTRATIFTNARLRLLLVISISTISLVQTIWAQPSLASRPMSSGDQASLRQGLEAYDQGKIEAAEPILRDLATRYPRKYEPMEALGSLYVESGDLPRALPYLQHAAGLSPNQSIAHANLGAAYLKLGRPQEAVRELQLAARLDPHNAETQSGLGQALMAVHQPGPAAQAFAAASNLQPGNHEIAYNRALALYESNALRQASEILGAIPPDLLTDQGHSLAGDVEEKLGKYKEAIAHYQAAAKLNPSDANLYSLTLELLRHWAWAEALQVANYSASRYPDATHFKVAAGIALYADNKYPGAVTAFSALLTHDPNNAMYADLLGRSCGALAEDTSEDCKGLEAFALAHPGNARIAEYAAADILRRPVTQQDTTKAEQLLHQAVTADPKLAEAYYQLGVLAQQRSQWQESSTVLEKAILLRPGYAEAHYRLSRAYAHMGRRDDAQKQMALQQQYSQQEKDQLNSRLQEVVTFLLKPM